MPADEQGGLPRPTWRQPWARMGLLRALVLVASVLLLLFAVPLVRHWGGRAASIFRHDSWFEGTLPAPRGRQLARNGSPLAWSTRHFSLNWHVPAGAREARDQLAILRSFIKRIQVGDAEILAHCGGQVMLCRELSGGEFLAVSRIRDTIGGLELQSYTERCRTPIPSLAATIGTVQVVDGRESGISGAERTHDATLRGHPGRFRVMMDHSGKWVPETWQKMEDVRPGNDVYLPVTLPATPAAPAAKP